MQKTLRNAFNLHAKNTAKFVEARSRRRDPRPSLARLTNQTASFLQLFYLCIVELQIRYKIISCSTFARPITAPQDCLPFSLTFYCCSNRIVFIQPPGVLVQDHFLYWHQRPNKCFWNKLPYSERLVEFDKCNKTSLKIGWD